MEHNYEELEKKYSELPDDIREAMSSVDVAKTVENIGKSHSLHIDQIGDLMDEVSFVMLGITHPSDFIPKIQKILSIDNRKAQEITKDINESIFRPIKASLLSIHGAGVDKKSALRQQEKNTEKEIVRKDSKADNTEHKNNIEFNKLPTIKKMDEKPLPKIDEKDIVEEKLGGEFKIPSEKKEIVESGQQNANDSEKARVDPYREPIE